MSENANMLNNSVEERQIRYSDHSSDKYAFHSALSYDKIL